MTYEKYRIEKGACRGEQGVIKDVGRPGECSDTGSLPLRTVLVSSHEFWEVMLLVSVYYYIAVFFVVSILTLGLLSK